VKSNAGCLRAAKAARGRDAQAELAQPETHRQYAGRLKENILDMENRRQSALINRSKVEQRLCRHPSHRRHTPKTPSRASQKQRAPSICPCFPTTTIGSFPQTDEVRKLRLRLKKGELTPERYEAAHPNETEQAVRWQEESGVDCWCTASSSATTWWNTSASNWRASRSQETRGAEYGARGVKPPIIYGDVEAPCAMTVKWSRYSQSLTNKPVKACSTGAGHDPAMVLEGTISPLAHGEADRARDPRRGVRSRKAGIRIIQIDETGDP